MFVYGFLSGTTNMNPCCVDISRVSYARSATRYFALVALIVCPPFERTILCFPFFLTPLLHRDVVYESTVDTK